jgi:hypothetical protein
LDVKRQEVTEECRKLHNDKLDLYSSPNIISDHMKKSATGEMMNTNKT